MDIPGGGTEVDELLDRDDQEQEEFFEELQKKVQTTIKDIGTLRKELTITVPDELIHRRLGHDYDELRSDVVLPGFRKGRAPLALVQKRFGSAVRDSLKTTVLTRSLLASIKNNEIEMLGDPLFKVDSGKGEKLVDLSEAMQSIKLPDSGDFTYVCEVEVKPTFELPRLEGIEIKSPKIEITDESVSAEIERQLKIRGRYEPVADGAAEGDDVVIADATLKVGDETVKTEANLQLGVRAARLDGVSLEKLGDVLRGARPGDERSIECEIPDDYERTDLRGKPGRFEFKIHELKRLAPVPIQTLLESLGCESEQELREYVRQEMESERDNLIRRAQKAQIFDYLLENTELTLPENLSARMTDRAVMRRVVELQQEGVPQGEIEAQIDELRVSAREQAQQDLKLEFILERVASRLGVYVTDEEVNTAIAQIARRYNNRFDRVRDELRNRGLLSQLAESIRQQKCFEILLAEAKITEVEAPVEKPTRSRKAK